MVTYKRLYGKDAAFFQSLIRENNEDTVVDVNNTRYVIRSLENDNSNSVQEDIESNQDLKQMIKESKKDIQGGHLFSSEEVLDMIERGEI